MMSENPLAPDAYAVLGVSSSVTEEELRRAYRRRLRESHPDTGGSAAQFESVQRAWALVGTRVDRERYDRGAAAPGTEAPSWAPPAPNAGTPSRGRPQARTYGHPGGWRRERYLTMMREWVGRGESLPDPYDPRLVRDAPRDVQHSLADALAEEATARITADLGLGFTVWHDVATGDAEHKLDHVVLGATGLFALQSEDFGGPVRVRRGEVFGESVGDDRPMHALEQRARVLSRGLRVKFTALLLVLPDGDVEEQIVQLGSSRGALTAVVRRSALSALLRGGFPGMPLGAAEDIFALRTRLQEGIRFVDIEGVPSRG